MSAMSQQKLRGLYPKGSFFEFLTGFIIGSLRFQSPGWTREQIQVGWNAGFGESLSYVRHLGPVELSETYILHYHFGGRVYISRDNVVHTDASCDIAEALGLRR